MDSLSNVTMDQFLRSLASSLRNNSKISHLFSKKLSTPYYERLKEGDPMEFIQQVLSFYESTHHAETNPFKPILLVPIIFYERITNQSLINLLTSLFHQRNIRIIFFLTQHSVSANKIYWNPETRISTTSFSIPLCTAHQIMERVILDIFVKGKLPIHIPYQIFSILRDEFQEYLGCVSTFLQRITMLLQSHFEQRKSILCMASEWEWLVSVRNLYIFFSFFFSLFPDM